MEDKKKEKWTPPKLILLDEIKPEEDALGTPPSTY